ncbi:MAG: hypothetical protein HYX69_11105 [Planctomycetia bacterium]|nr:hypothetical protein [Planctomycetia bacterium]
MYWGDMCTGNPHCSTCDQCGNWVGPPSPGGNGVPAEVYGHRGPYGQQVARASRQMRSPEMIVRRGPSRPATSQVVRASAPPRVAPQMARRSAPPQYAAPQVVRRSSPRPTSSRPAPQTAGRGHRQEYEGAVEVLGVTDRVTVPASAYATSRRNEPTLADEPAAEQVSATTPVRSTSRR